MTDLDKAVERAKSEVARRRGAGVNPEDLPEDARHWSGEALASLLLTALSAKDAELAKAREALKRADQFVETLERQVTRSDVLDAISECRDKTRAALERDQ